MKTWKSIVRRLDTVIKGTGERAWEIASSVKLLWDDPEFLKQACDSSKAKVEEKLAGYAAAVGRHLNDLLQMIEHFPAKSDWKDDQLVSLYDETCRLIAQKRSQQRKEYADGETITRKRVALAEYEALQNEYEALQKKYRASQAEVRRLRKIIEANPKLAKVA